MTTPQKTSATAHEYGREFEFSHDEFEFIAGLIYERTGIVLAQNKFDMVYSRLVRRLRILGLPDFASYCDRLRGDEADSEIRALVNAITTNLTHFFREPHHFEMLSSMASKQIKRQPRLRIWSAGCSSGMEPYSAAMTLLKALPDNALRDVKILATDIDSGMLEKAREGDYHAEEYENIPALCRQYVALDGETMRVGPEPRRLIAFNELNLLDEWPMKGPFDAIFCRNVMIYFDAATKAALIERYIQLLRPGGLLLIGHSESVPTTMKGIVAVGRTAYQREA